jgi:hypothetical protein
VRALGLALAATLAAACGSNTDDGAGEARGHYEPCAGGECEGTATCHELSWDFGMGSVCTRECESELDCPIPLDRDVRCLDVGRTGDFLCHVSCLSDGQCPATWVCQPLGTGGSVCLP